MRFHWPRAQLIGFRACHFADLDAILSGDYFAIMIFVGLCFYSVKGGGIFSILGAVFQALTVRRFVSSLH